MVQVVWPVGASIGTPVMGFRIGARSQPILRFGVALRLLPKFWDHAAGAQKQNTATNDFANKQRIWWFPGRVIGLPKIY